MSVMNKRQSTLDARRAYIKDRLETTSKPASECVREISAELFLSQRTVWRDASY